MLLPVPAAVAASGASASPSVSIQQQQVQVVTLDHQAPISAAQNAVDVFTQAVDSDRQAVTDDQATAARAAAAVGQDTRRLDADQNALTSATAARRVADSTLAGDRARLAGIAIGVYTGALSAPSLHTIPNFQDAENQALDVTQVQLVAGIVDSNIHRDLTVDTADIATESTDRTKVEGAQSTLAGDRSTFVTATAGASRAQAALSTDENRLSGADTTLGAVENALTAAISSLAGPSSTPAGQVSLIGGAALGAAQLAGWYNYEGYVDLTSAPIGRLAGWYIQYGQEMGVRGDLAFAQAVLETGGFSSPDAVNLSNFAGIGHCDSCNSGWSFPSPSGGVLGQIQLLRIFADNGPVPPGAPGPVLPQLTTAKQYEAGCCSTVESLTGVWATDPTYGEQILSIYSQMLDFALSAA